MSHFPVQPLPLNGPDLAPHLLEMSLEEQAARVGRSLNRAIQGVEGLRTETTALQQAAESLGVQLAERVACLGEGALIGQGGSNLKTMLVASHGLLAIFAKGLTEQYTILGQQLGSHNRIINGAMFQRHDLGGRVAATQSNATSRLFRLREFLVSNQAAVEAAEGALALLSSGAGVAGPLPVLLKMNRLIQTLPEAE
jgi:hypothetical protein